MRTALAVGEMKFRQTRVQKSDLACCLGNLLLFLTRGITICPVFNEAKALATKIIPSYVNCVF